MQKEDQHLLIILLSLVVALGICTVLMTRKETVEEEVQVDS